MEAIIVDLMTYLDRYVIILDHLVLMYFINILKIYDTIIKYYILKQDVKSLSQCFEENINQSICTSFNFFIK